MYLQKIKEAQVSSFHQEIEMPWKKSFLSLMRRNFVEDLVQENSITFSQNKDNTQFIRENWDKIKHLTLVDPFRMGVLIDLLEQVKDIEGDIVECGSYKGGSGILMGLWLKKHGVDKKIYLLDSFAGLPDPDAVNDKGYKKGQFVSDYELVKSEVEKNGLSDIIIIHKGWFSETVPKIKDEVKIALFHVDCDLYPSTNDCFPDLYPKVSPNGAIVLDDFNDGGGGEKKAVHEYFAKTKTSEIIQIGPAPQSFIIKGQMNGDHIEVSNQFYSHSEIEKYGSYLEWLQANFGINLIDQINKLY